MSVLDDLRVRIDEIDEEIVRLLNRRADLVLEVKAAKEESNVGIYSVSRERQIMENVCRVAGEGRFPKEALQRIFGGIVSASRSLIGRMAISFLGPELSMAHLAAIRQFGEDVDFSSEASISDLIRRVERREVQCGVLPARDASGSLISGTFLALRHSRLKIIAEVEIGEHLGLYGKAESIRAIRRVYGSAASLESAGRWLAVNLAGAELIVKQSASEALACALHDKSAVAVLQEEAGERFDTGLLAKRIEAESDRRQVFVVIGYVEGQPTGGDKTTLLCGFEDCPGALRKVLEPFSRYGVTLLRVESRLLAGNPSECLFFIDALGHDSEEGLAAAIAESGRLGISVRVLGSYPLVCCS